MPMQDSMPEDSGAGDELAAPPKVGDMASKSLTVPREYLPNCKVGDTYTVKSADDDNVVLEDAGGSMDGDPQWGSDLAKAAPRGDY
jgi:hypothetical protein